MKIPKPYFSPNNHIKAFVLGCDPTAFDKDKKLLQFEFVFDLNNENSDKRYFSGISANLECIGLNLERIYVQNLITDYLDKYTAENKDWKGIAIQYIETRKQEFDTIDPTGTIPVLLTSGLLYEVLLNEDQTKYSPKEIYQLKTAIPISSESNKLGRPLIPLFRHFHYSLANKEHAQYKDALKKYFS
jgi:hypothetical protein